MSNFFFLIGTAVTSRKGKTFLRWPNRISISLSQVIQQEKKIVGCGIVHSGNVCLEQDNKILNWEI